jgi:hypothetical protein
LINDKLIESQSKSFKITESFIILLLLLFFKTSYNNEYSLQYKYRQGLFLHIQPLKNMLKAVIGPSILAADFARLF